jgi:hypothetical protein
VPRFIYGGYDSTANPNVLSDVWMCSPFQVSNGFALLSRELLEYLCRYRQTADDCRGWCAYSTYTSEWTGEDPPADPWAQGLGILDLPSLSWSDQYDSEASAYNSPEVVMNWYSNGYVDDN